MFFVWQFVLLVVFGALLAVSAQFVVKAASAIAQDLGVKSFILAFFFLGILTSTPEIFVSIQSIVSGVPQLAMGTLVGGSILLLSLVIGGSSVILGKVSLNHGFTFSEIILTSTVVVAPVIVLWDGSLTRLDGGLLICAYILQILFFNSREHVLRQVEKNAGASKGIGRHMVLLLLGIIGIVVSSKVMVNSAQNITSVFGIAPFIFGLILLSFGTNLPEFSLAIESVLLQKRAIAFGDFMGSAAANTLILGILGVASPFEATDQARLRLSLVLLVCIVSYFLWVLNSRKEITRKEGLGLLFFYALFVVFELV